MRGRAGCQAVNEKEGGTHLRRAVPGEALALPPRFRMLARRALALHGLRLRRTQPPLEFRHARMQPLVAAAASDTLGARDGELRHQRGRLRLQRCLGLRDRRRRGRRRRRRRGHGGAGGGGCDRDGHGSHRLVQDAPPARRLIRIPRVDGAAVWHEVRRGGAVGVARDGALVGRRGAGRVRTREARELWREGAAHRRADLLAALGRVTLQLEAVLARLAQLLGELRIEALLLHERPLQTLELAIDALVLAVGARLEGRDGVLPRLLELLGQPRGEQPLLSQLRISRLEGGATRRRLRLRASSAAEGG